MKVGEIDISYSTITIFFDGSHVYKIESTIDEMETLDENIRDAVAVANEFNKKIEEKVNELVSNAKEIAKTYNARIEIHRSYIAKEVKKLLQELGLMIERLDIDSQCVELVFRDDAGFIMHANFCGDIVEVPKNSTQ